MSAISVLLDNRKCLPNTRERYISQREGFSLSWTITLPPQCHLKCVIIDTEQKKHGRHPSQTSFLSRYVPFRAVNSLVILFTFLTNFQQFVSCSCKAKEHSRINWTEKNVISLNFKFIQRIKTPFGVVLKTWYIQSDRNLTKPQRKLRLYTVNSYYENLSKLTHWICFLPFTAIPPDLNCRPGDSREHSQWSIVFESRLKGVLRNFACLVWFSSTLWLARLAQKTSPGILD